MIRLALAVAVIGLAAGCNLPWLDEDETTVNTVPDIPQVQAETVILNTGNGNVDASTSGSAAQ